MTSKHPTLGNPAFVSQSGGGAESTQLSRTAMQGTEARFKEDFLQQMIMANPSLLPVKDIVPTTSALISLGREIAVDVGGQAGYIDNLLVTNEGRLVAVETKLWRNPESTREVIVQTLQYGMALSAMSLRELESRLPLLKAKGQTISDLVAAHPSGELRVDDFEEALERNLRRGDMVYLIVSDGIRVGVERITHWLGV